MKKLLISVVFVNCCFVLFSAEKETSINNDINFGYYEQSNFTLFATSKNKKPVQNKKTTKKVNLVLTTPNKVGIGLMTAGGIFTLSGAGLLIFDLVYYFPFLEETTVKAQETKDYRLYDTTYNNNLTLFISSLSILGLGVVFIVVSIPLLAHTKSVKSAMLLNIDIKKDLSLYLSFSI